MSDMSTTISPPPTDPHEAPTDKLQPAWPAELPPAPPVSAGPPTGRRLLLRTGDATACVALHKRVTHLGRGLTADVRLDDHLVSRHHAVIVLGPSGPRLIDDRSANGVILNGRPIGEADLHHGDVIALGRSVLRYLDD